MRVRLPARVTDALPEFSCLTLGLSACVVTLDQLTKYAVSTAWPESGKPVVVIPHFFHLVHFRNSGAAWGILRGHSQLLSVVSVVVLIILALNFQKLVEGRLERAIALGLMLGGIAGNLLDRGFRGEVVDFLLFFYRSFQWPAFNIADSGITCGVTLFVLSSFLCGPQEQQPDVPGA